MAAPMSPGGYRTLGVRPRVPFPRRTDGSALRRRYLDYCHGQASALLDLVPRDAVRPLYRRAREWATGRGLHEAKDPMATLLRYCRELLPLPPFEVWREDYEGHQTAYLRLAAEGPLYAWSAEPVLVDARDITMDGRAWSAGLSVFRDGGSWRGFIGFRQSPSDPGVRTADVFCEDDPKDIRERFQDLTSHTLQAFLRSALP